MVTAQEIADAWNSVDDRWFTRRNKIHDSHQWEAVHDWGGEIMSDKTMALIGRFETPGEAEQAAAWAEDMARAEAVLKIMSS